MQFTDLTAGPSLQRKQQLLTDEPLQIFYATDYTQNEPTAPNRAVFEHRRAMASQLDAFDGDLKLLQYPMARNEVIIRLENLSDLFDGTPSETPMFDIGSYASSLYASANGGAAPADMVIEERNLSNNMNYSEMLERKFQWLSEDGPNPYLAQPYPTDESDTVVAMQPQRIRLFKVNYTAASAEPELIMQ